MTNEDQLKTSPGWRSNISKKKLQGQEGKELFHKTNKVLIKIHNIRDIYCLAYYLTNVFPGLLERLKYLVVYFYPATNIVETTMDSSPLLVIYLFN